MDTIDESSVIVELMVMCLEVNRKIAEFYQKRSDLIDIVFACVIEAHKKIHPEMNEDQLILEINKTLRNPDLLQVIY